MIDERGHVLLALLAIGVTLIFVGAVYWSLAAIVRALATGRVRMPNTDEGDPVWRYRDSDPVSFWINLAIKLAAAVLSLYILFGIFIPLWFNALQ
ncbi:hypothetical protein BRAS3843_190041 [Bradyrhizobium sp. STM 3843]|uniref:hypothetical protein n=1 Tax=Bradyrhizobium sp. STM 3843 TaxID=551947 RepID=UPI00024076B4|nr:hypothetical protein [Bradyrhizobium sp. STM 3843]CCE07000.1 hypothetical protein BRAS3843_190041 [Bradyrhizobium sp. STM 3843]